MFQISLNPKTKKLLVRAPFNRVQQCREFPSRRWDPKTKGWIVPLVAANLRYLESIKAQHQTEFTAEALDAIGNFEKLTSGPVYIPFPRHIYDFTGCERGDLIPFKHQDMMLDKTWNLQAMAWFAKMGTGKTYAAIHLACARWKTGLIDGIAIICPSTLRNTWRKELQKYATVPINFREHESAASWLTNYYQDRDPAALKVLAVSVEGLGVSEKLFDSACGFYVGRRIFTIVDESSRIKNPTALRTKRTIDLGAVSAFRLILNGTPIALGIHDLWAQYEFLDPNIIGCGDYWAFRTRYVEYGGFEDRQIVGYKHVDELMGLITPYTVEVDKSVLNLPPKIPKQRYVQATPEQKTLFRQIIKGKGPHPRIQVKNVLERMLRLRQVIGGFRPETIIVAEGTIDQEEKTILHALDKNPKMDDLVQFISDHEIGSKFIIWASFVPEIEAIVQVLSEKFGASKVMAYYGATDKEERIQIEHDYCNDPDKQFFVGNPTTAGLGLTLVSPVDDIMYYYSGTSAFIDRSQSEDRAHRIGQTRSVVVVDSIMEKTFDEAILASTAAKLDIERYVFEQLRQGASEIDIFGGGE